MYSQFECFRRTILPPKRTNLGHHGSRSAGSLTHGSGGLGDLGRAGKRFPGHPGVYRVVSNLASRAGSNARPRKLEFGYDPEVAYPTDLLYPGEEIVLDLRPHWWFYAPQALALVLVVIVAIVVLAVDLPDAVKILVGLIVLGTLGWFAKQYAVWTTTNFVLTTSRLIYRSGVIAKSGIEIPLDRINTVFFNQSVIQRLFGMGNLEIESAGEQGRQTFTRISKPQRVQAEIYTQKEEDERRNLTAMGDAAAGGGSSASIPEQINQLDELRSRGVITDAEFESKKADLLNRM